MKLFHTADWHLGKLVQGVYMTEDQRYVLDQFIAAIREEKPDAVIIAGDLYDRAVPPTDAVALLDDVLKTIIVDLKTPVLAIAGNHDSPGRLQFGSQFMRENGYYIAGQMTERIEPVVLTDVYGEVHIYLVPFADPSIVRNVYDEPSISTHEDAMRKVIETIESSMEPDARHIFVGHAFVTPHGEHEENTSDSERPIAVGGTEYIPASLFEGFHYTALGHLHRAHYVKHETIRYAGSPLKYSISEEHHEKGYYIVELDGEGAVKVEKKTLTPKRDMRTIEATIEEIKTHEKSDDYIFVQLLDETAVLHPMEKIRAIYPNAMHVMRKVRLGTAQSVVQEGRKKDQLTDEQLFEAFYTELKGEHPDEETLSLFQDVFHQVMNEEDDK
ncbi:MAG TPA: exonuclease SbcCD subunit D [Sporosarcina sp.]|nr:exonuclease SbcCD subunit D [Sporosarcina sp.]